LRRDAAQVRSFLRDGGFTGTAVREKDVMAVVTVTFAVS
jgi:hypothetical protein